MQNMAKNQCKKRGHHKEKDWKVKPLAAKHGVTERYVHMVVNGECSNEAIFSDYMFLFSGENKLLQAVKNLVAF
jgi:hypothetical protein